MRRGEQFGLWDVVLYAAAMMLSLRWLATAASAGPASLPIWALAAFLFLGPLAIASAELTSRFEGEGAIYTWTREAFGPFAGYICAWLYWTCNLPFFSGLFLFIANVAAQAAGQEAQRLVNEPAIFLWGSIALALSIGLTHAAGLGVGKWLPTFGAASTFLILVVLIISGGLLFVAGRSATDFAVASYAPPLNADGAALWATMVFAFGGAEGVAVLRNETHGGMRVIVRALAIVGVLLAFAYVAGSAAMLAILHPSEATRLDGIPDAIVAGFDRLGIAALSPWALVLLALSMLGALSAWFGVAARLPFAVGVDSHLPAVFAKRNPTTGAPVAAIIAQTIAVIVLLALSQAGETLESAYDFLVAMSVLSYTLPFLFLFAAYWRVQSKRSPEGAWIAPGGAGVRRIIAAIGFLTAVTAIVASLVPSSDTPDKLGAALKLIGSSAVLIGIGVIAFGTSLAAKKSSTL